MYAYLHLNVNCVTQEVPTYLVYLLFHKTLWYISFINKRTLLKIWYMMQFYWRESLLAYLSDLWNVLFTQTKFSKRVMVFRSYNMIL